MGTLERLEAKQNEAIRLISEQKQTQTRGMDLDPFELLTAPTHPSEAFEKAFYDMVRAYREMNEDERPTKIRKLVGGTQYDPTVMELVNSLHSSKATPVPPQKEITPTYLAYSAKPGVQTNNTGNTFPEDIDLDKLVDDLFSS